MASDTSAAWAEVTRFEKEGVAVVVKKSNQQRPRFSLQVLFTKPDGAYTPYRTVRWRRTPGGSIIQVEHRQGALLDALMTEAENWIEEQWKADEKGA